jgi:hypothetical protein
MVCCAIAAGLFGGLLWAQRRLTLGSGRRGAPDPLAWRPHVGPPEP